MGSSGTEILELKRKIKCAPKMYHLSVRLDLPTKLALEELERVLGLKTSDVVRAAIWFMVVLTDKNMTVRKALTESALKTLAEGSDLPLIDALKTFREMLAELGYMPRPQARKQQATEEKQ